MLPAMDTYTASPFITYHTGSNAACEKCNNKVCQGGCKCDQDCNCILGKGEPSLLSLWVQSKASVIPNATESSDKDSIACYPVGEDSSKES